MKALVEKYVRNYYFYGISYCIYLNQNLFILENAVFLVNWLKIQ